MKDKSVKGCCIQRYHFQLRKSPAGVFKHAETSQKMYHPIFALYMSFPQHSLLSDVRERGILREIDIGLAYYKFSYDFISSLTEELLFLVSSHIYLSIPYIHCQACKASNRANAEHVHRAEGQSLKGT